MQSHDGLVAGLIAFFFFFFFSVSRAEHDLAGTARLV